MGLGPLSLPRATALVPDTERSPVVMLVFPTRAVGSHSPAVGATSQLAGCLSAAGPHSPAGETSAGEEVGSAAESPRAALEVNMAPGDPSAGPILRRASKAQPRPQGVTQAGWDPTPETTSSPNHHLADAASRLFHHQLVHHGLQADAEHDGLQGRSVTSFHVPHSLPNAPH